MLGVACPPPHLLCSIHLMLQDFGWFSLTPSTALMNPCLAEAASSPFTSFSHPPKNHPPLLSKAFDLLPSVKITSIISSSPAQGTLMSSCFHLFPPPSIAGSQMWRTFDPLHFKTAGTFFLPSTHSSKTCQSFIIRSKWSPTGTEQFLPSLSHTLNTKWNSGHVQF